MKERPIIFSAPMVRAILEGRKTQTRRVIKPQPKIDETGNFCWNGWNYGQNFDGPLIQAIASPIPCARTKRVLCPYGKPGDRLWVRETHEVYYVTRSENTSSAGVKYKADGEKRLCPIGLETFKKLNSTESRGWSPSIHMPRWASRIDLEITGVRVERLKDISDADCKEEGALGRVEYSLLWESINGKDSWDKNPWVWVIEFKRTEP
jgi:hypothetical protein